MMETDHETGRDKNAGKVRRTRKRPRDGQGEVVSAVLNIWVLGGGFAVALSLGLYYLSSQRHVTAAYWFAGSGMLLVLASLIQVLPYAYRWDSDEDGLSESEKAALRPYVGVSHVKATMEIGKPISILLKFTNSGKTPAEDVEILQAFEKVKAGTAPDRTYAGRNFERRSIGPINVGNTVETEIIGHEWTLDELMTVTTNRSFQIFAHGIIRYRSEYISSETEERPFCYEFDPASGQMVICRAPGKTEAKPIDTADRAWITVSYAHLVSPLVVGQNPTVRVEFVNNGRTPALDVQIGGNVYSKSSAFPLEIRHNMQGEQKSKLPLGPGIPVTTFMDATEPFRNQGQIDVIVAGTHTLYAVGFITYNDAAGNGRRTDFCFKTGGANLKVTDETGYVMVACPIGNTAT